MQGVRILLVVFVVRNLAWRVLSCFGLRLAIVGPALWLSQSSSVGYVIHQHSLQGEDRLVQVCFVATG
jgi:hypothetical protein